MQYADLDRVIVRPGRDCGGRAEQQGGRGHKPGAGARSLGDRLIGCIHREALLFRRRRSARRRPVRLGVAKTVPRRNRHVRGSKYLVAGADHSVDSSLPTNAAGPPLRISAFGLKFRQMISFDTSLYLKARSATRSQEAPSDSSRPDRQMSDRRRRVLAWRAVERSGNWPSAAVALRFRKNPAPPPMARTLLVV